LSRLTFGQSIIPAPQTQANLPSKFDQTKLSALRFIYSSNTELVKDIQIFNNFLSQIGIKPLEEKVMNYDVVHLQFDIKQKDEAYTIQNKPNNVIEIRGGKHGVFYGLMSLLQGINESSNNKNLTAQNIIDQPSYSWRGMHLDVSRHFFSKDFVKKYIDILAIHKMNTFHWHLTDDQGWRIEIKKYPLLTKIGGKRKESMVDKNFNPYKGDGKPVEGYYTQDEIKEIVAYAKDRHITVVPEIEMPGHALAALSAYPEFSCTKKTFEPLTIWGVSDDVFCTNEASIRFLQDILDEVLLLFPSKYIHIGGDEVPKTRWKACEVCQKNMKMNSLKDEHELQSYFIKRMDKYVTSKGRSIIGWDEILEGGLAQNAAVMSWRGEDGGIAAAKLKHFVVMSPGTHCYFDHYQGNKNTEPLAIGGFTPIEKVYSYQPTPSALSETEKKYILGAQGNVWTEYIATSDHVEYMALPRLTALAEVLWSGEKKPGFADFAKRLRTHFTLLDKMKINYAKSIFDIVASSKIVNDQVEVSLKSTYASDSGAIQYYFVDDEPYLNIEKFNVGKPISLNHSRTIKAQYFENGKGLGKVLTEEFLVHKALGKLIKSTIEPSTYYNEGGLPKLLDSKAGHAPRTSSDWLGWSGKNPELLIDLGKVNELNKIDIYTLKEEMNWIYLPSKIEIAWSEDGVQFTSGQTLVQSGIDNGYTVEGKINYPLNQIQARYIKLNFTCAPKIMKGNPGEGEDAWLFLSEIVID